MKKELTFDELVEIATQRIHSELLVGGGKAMKGEIYTWMAKAIEWSREGNKKNEKTNRL